MPRYFFDYRDGQGNLEPDDEGVEFPNLQAAYTDAIRAAVDMHVDACCEGQCATDDAFEIRDEFGRLVLALPFAQALSERRF